MTRRSMRSLVVVWFLSTALAACGRSGNAPAPVPVQAEQKVALSRAETETSHPELKSYPDGTAAMSGKTWIAGFSKGGVEFRLRGQDRGLALAFQSAECGGRLLATRKGGSRPVVSARDVSVAYTHGEGAVTEHYLGLAAGLEQVFVVRDLAGQKAGGDDLLVRCSLAGDVRTEARRDDWGYQPIVFASGAGAVTLGIVMVRDAAGRESPMPLSLDERGYGILVLADWLADASFPIEIDPILGASVHLSGTINLPDNRPEACYNADNDEFLVVFQRDFGANDHDVRAQRVDANGNPAGSAVFVDDLASEDGQWPAAAWNPVQRKYLVAWQQKNAQGQTDILARTVDLAGAMGAIINVSQGTAHNPADDGQPDVAADANGGNWLVVFQRQFGATPTDIDVRGQLVSATATVGFVIKITTRTDSQKRPSVNPLCAKAVAGPYRWLVAWEDEQDGGAGAPWNIYAREVRTDGTMPNSEFRAHAQTSKAERRPEVAGVGPKYLVAYEREWEAATASTRANNDVLASIVDVNTLQVTKSIQVQAASHDSFNVGAACYNGIAGIEYLISWTDSRSAPQTNLAYYVYDVYAERVDANGTTLEDDFVVANKSGVYGEEGTPRAAARDKAAEPSYLIAYDSMETGKYQVFAARTAPPLPPPTIITPGLSGQGQNIYYNESIDAIDGVSPYSWDIVPLANQGLPPGLSLDKTVTGLSTTISGTPTTVGTYYFTVRIRDAQGRFDDETFDIIILGIPTITTTQLQVPDGTVNDAYTATLDSTGTSAPFGPHFWTVSAGSLPPGLYLGGSSGPSETIDGVPTLAGTYTFTIQVEDAFNFTDEETYTITVTDIQGPVISTTALATGTVNSAYSATISANQTVLSAPYTWTIASGSLPTGVTLGINPNPSSSPFSVTLSGTPTVAGTYDFEVEVSDSGSRADKQSYTLRIAPGAPPTITTQPPLAGASLNVAYTATIVASQPGAAASPPYTWAVSAGSLPPGLSPTNNTPSGPSIDIAGTPTQAGTFQFTIKLTDGNVQSAQQDYTIVVSSGPSFTTAAALKAAYAGQPYNAVLAISGGAPPYTVGLQAGAGNALPSGLAIAQPSAQPASAGLGGVAPQAGNYSFILEVADSAGNKGNLTFTLQVVDMLVITQNFSLPDAAANQLNYSAALAVTGGVAPYAWSPTPVAGALPGGLTIDASTGAITGTVSTLPSTYHFTVRVTDANGMADEESFFIDVQGGPRFLLAKVSTTPGVVPPVALPSALAGVAYSADVSATAGIAPLSYSLAGGNAPAGLAVDSGSGKLSGTPASAGSFSFVVQVTDSRTVANGGPQIAAQTFELTVAAQPSAAAKRRKGLFGCSISSFDGGAGEGGDPLSGALVLLVALAGVYLGRIRSRSA